MLEQVVNNQVSAPVEGKGFGPRAGAYIIDSLIIVIGNNVVGFIFGLVLGVILTILEQPLSLNEQRLQLVQLVGGLGLTLLYYTLFEGFIGASIGKLLLGMRVVKIDGSHCGFRAALVRALWRLVDGLFFGVIAYSSMKETPLQQRFGDKYAKTIVVGHQDPFIQSQRPVWLVFVAGILYSIALMVEMLVAIAIAWG